MVGLILAARRKMRRRKPGARRKRFMSHYIVLVKQVPDVTQITDNAFDPQTGNLMRGRLPSVINELDSQALAFAVQMRNMANDQDGKVIALTMGPPMADEVLRYSLSRHADIAVLLTDRSLGGADTCATANPLAFAIRRIAKEILGGSNDYYIVSGMQSVDGDTAQVPAQVAEELGIPCIAYVTDAEFVNGRFEFTRIISGGSQTVASKNVPAAITVAKYEYPLFAGVSSMRKAYAMDIVKWGADDIKATHIGVGGSKTRVIRVFPPPKTTRKCVHITDIDALAKVILESYKTGELEVGSGPAKQKHYLLPTDRTDKFDRSYEGLEKDREAYEKLREKLHAMQVSDAAAISTQQKEQIVKDCGFSAREMDNLLAGFPDVTPAYQGEVWVMAEHDGDAIHSATFELIGKARDLAESLKTKVGVILVGDKMQSLTPPLIAAGADNVYVIEHPLLAEFDPTSYCKAAAQTIEKYWPQIVLYGATPQGRVLAPMVAYRLGCGLTADCTSLDIRDASKGHQVAILHQTRPALGGNVMATICTKDSKSQMATARPGVMKSLAPDPARKGQVLRQEIPFTSEDVSLEILKTEKGGGGVNFHAEVIISGGRGLQSRDNYQQLLDQICTSVSTALDTHVERGASRAAVEEGFIDRAHQVGQTGTAVGPKIYMAMGISGAIQHMIGVASSQTIIAVNRDPNAPVFKQSDYYLVGNIEDIIPQLAEKLGEHSEQS
jgi:electron transfer flavoprotein alpha subunit